MAGMMVPRGKMLGGSSGINYIAYVRGHPGDFDSWAAGGAGGWSYDEVLPYFKKSEGLAPSGDIIIDAQAHSAQGHRYELCAHLDALAHCEVQVATELIDTGRRPEQVCALPLDCLARDSDGAPVLVHENRKANRRCRESRLIPGIKPEADPPPGGTLRLFRPGPEPADPAAGGRIRHPRPLRRTANRLKERARAQVVNWRRSSAYASRVKPR